MSVPRVTVVIPTFNRARFLPETIQSVLDQTYTDFEILISDDASTDNTTQVVLGFQDPRIHYHRHSKNIGITPNWQFVVSQARTELIAMLADDDIYLPEHLSTAIQALDDYPKAVYYTCEAKYFGKGIAEGSGYRPQGITDTETSLIYVSPRQAVRFLGSDNPGPINGMICRARVLQDPKLYWGKQDYIPQDLLVMTQLMVQGGFIFGNRSTTKFRIHGANTSLVNGIARLRYNCMVWYGVRWLVQFLLDRNICTLVDIETHGFTATSLEQHVVPLVLGLASYDSSPEQQVVAYRIFQQRRDADKVSTRFRLARLFGFWTLPLAEKISQFRVGWQP